MSIPILLASSIASATLIQTANDFGNGNQQQFAGTVLSNDLINTGQATLASVTVTNYTPFSDAADPGSPDFVLNDGDHGGDGAAASTSGFHFTAFDIIDSVFQVTYSLDLTLSPLGYDLTRIRTYAAHYDNRTGQGYEVFVDFASDGLGDFVSLGTFSGTNAGGFNQASRVTLENDVGPGIDAFATGVAAIRFDMNFPSTGAETVWRELDVEGFASVPEPSTGLLLALGLSGLAWRSRREH